MWKKLAIAVALVACVVLFVSYSGLKTIKASPVYGLAQLEVQKRYGVNPSELEMKWLKPFKFSEGAFSADAEFVLCDHQDNCYGVKADKKFGDWRIEGIAKK